MKAMIKKDLESSEEIKKHIQEYQDFPKIGILFRDIMPLFSSFRLLQITIDTLIHSAQQFPHFDTLIGIESRGFLLGPPIALRMTKSFIAARKKGKLPGNVASETYKLEYGVDTIEIQHEGILPNTNYIIIDDLLATGGTALATARLIQKNGGNIVGFLFLIELSELKGMEHLREEFSDTPIHSIITY